MSGSTKIDTSLFRIMKYFHSTQLHFAFVFGYTEKEIIGCVHLHFHYYHFKQLYYKNAGVLFAELCNIYDEHKTETCNVPFTEVNENFLCIQLKRPSFVNIECQKVVAKDGILSFKRRSKS